MKGVVLAGGLGTRFHPVTRVVNKHLLDVFDEPMVFYPIRSLVSAGIRDIAVVTGVGIEQFQKLLGDGSEFGVSIQYAEQEGELGIAHALDCVRPLVEGSPVVVVLGDNIYQQSLTPFVERFRAQGEGARLLLKEVAPADARRFGVAEVIDGRIRRIVEKPDDPVGNLVVTGCYMYDSEIFDIISTLTPSARGEYEITDVNNAYVDRSTCEFDIVQGWWTDAGTPASKLKASILVALEKGVTFHA